MFRNRIKPRHGLGHCPIISLSILPCVDQGIVYSRTIPKGDSDVGEESLTL